MLWGFDDKSPGARAIDERMSEETKKLARRGLVTQPKDCEEAARGRVW